MIGTVRNCKPEQCIIESKYDNTNIIDLRLTSPFEEVVTFSNSFDLQSLDNAKFKHVPYVAILIQAKQVWMNSHGGLPNTLEEKKEFN